MPAFLKKLPDVVQEKTAPPTFSVHSNRVRKVTLLDRTFAPVKDLTTEAFGHSLDVNRGKPERIQIRFGPRVASYVRERTWHASQQLDVRPGGGVRLTLEVCRDWALRTWILDWGAHARVLAPSALAEEILAQLDEARDGYVPKLAFETSRALLPPQARRLPLRGCRAAGSVPAVSSRRRSCPHEPPTLSRILRDRQRGRDRQAGGLCARGRALHRHRSHQRSARRITELYLARIEALNQMGPELRAIIEVNPDALTIADALDAERKAGTVRGSLHGIPIALKDNLDTHDRMTTTAGSLALEGSIPPQDSFVAQKLREAGAVLIAKANMSEWAYWRGLNASSGWSGRGGQGRNPYALDRTTCGSSSGSGAAAVANLGRPSPWAPKPAGR